MPVHDRLAARFPGLVTIIVPRHPERGADIAALAAPRAVARRRLGEGPPEGGVWVADTLGEMGLFYRLAPFAFVGRSFVKLGGQNPLEPARLGRAVAMGPHVFNFPEAVALLHGAGALVQVDDPAALADWVAAMLDAPDEAAAMGARGAAALRGFEGLPARVAGLLAGLADARA
jgi:3-deoxy-D-manno-octulosonic-acid transferase